MLNKEEAKKNTISPAKTTPISKNKNQIGKNNEIGNLKALTDKLYKQLVLSLKKPSLLSSLQASSAEKLIKDQNLINSGNIYEYAIKEVEFEQCNANWNYLQNGADWDCMVLILLLVY